jgi:NTP pyrophosphatase (non-canonical NTP hydrolase)
MRLDLEKLKMDLRRFAKARAWEKYHSPKNLSMALAVEASELLERFQWLTEDY